jgi:hypothetical protein
MVVIANINAASKQAMVANFNQLDTRNVQLVGRAKTTTNANARRECLTTKSVYGLNPSVAVDVRIVAHAN